MLSLSDLIRALVGLKRLLGMRVDAFDVFDASPKGFWASFWVALMVLPVWGLAIVDQMARVADPAPIRYVAFQIVGYAIGWLAYPLAMVRISDYLDRWPQFYRYMVAYNWFQLVQAVAWLPLLLAVDAGAPAGLVALTWLVTHGILITYGWFIARRGLQVDGLTACALVVIDLLLSLLIDRLSELLV